VSLVFVQSRDGNTVADDPAQLGGGETDTHLIYEGLSRVDVDAVLAGASTARDGNVVFSVWHPELVALRQQLAGNRHPAQIVVTATADLPLADGLLFTTSELRVFIVAPSRTAAGVRMRIREQPWIDVIDAGDPLSMTAALRALRDRGIGRISAIGGRRTAATLIGEHLVSDLYLTTAARDGGVPHTPLFEGAPPPMTRVLDKAGRGPERGVRFEHFVLG
jgi:riboflavin biosynthesis pyrimidine reductase